MNIKRIGYIELPQAKDLQVATRLLPEPSLMEEGKIVIREMLINGELNPDVALIEASTNTPVQLYEGEGEVTEIFYSTSDNNPIGVILMSPEGELSIQIFNPKTDGGQRGYSIKKGWTMQTIIPEGTTLTFLDYWSPKGFASPDGGKMYGENVLTEVKDDSVLQKFKHAEVVLLEYIQSIV